MLVVAANQQMRSTTNLLIINLAVADLLFIVFCVPFTGTDYVLPFWPFGDVWCKIVQYLIVVTAYASVYTLVLMSLDRFLAVVHPITSMSVSPMYYPRQQQSKDHPNKRRPRSSCCSKVEGKPKIVSFHAMMA